MIWEFIVENEATQVLANTRDYADLVYYFAPRLIETIEAWLNDLGR